MARSPRSGSHAAPNPPVEYRLPPFRGKEEDISSNPSSSGGASGGAASEMMTHPLAVSAIPTSAESAGTCPSTIAARRRTTSELDPKMAMEMLVYGPAESASLMEYTPAACMKPHDDGMRIPRTLDESQRAAISSGTEKAPRMSVRAIKPLDAAMPPTAATRTEKMEAPKEIIAAKAREKATGETDVPPPPSKTPAIVIKPAKTSATLPHCAALRYSWYTK
mmetsp:Transcript_31498/g.100414  ORF Transcript_31498/g.100414 Transcript_31498/m.100414 type:complete len:221 (+) Transcript_31498:451-1113(+)